ncbi:MAG: nucleotide exchange factor GrpE [Patescibacteria group bacterium]
MNDPKQQKDEENDVIVEPEATDDVEPTDEEGAVLGATAKLKELREKLKKCESEKSEYLTGWQRMKADTVNARKRDEERQKEMIQYANEGLILDLLPVLDSFEMAKANKEAWEKVDKNWRTGIEYIQSQILTILEKNNLKEINPIGQVYNALEHEAIEMLPAKDESEDGKVLLVINKGYKLGDRVIRPPKVKVGEWKVDSK